MSKPIRKQNMVQSCDYTGYNLLEQFSFGHTSIIDMSTETSDFTLGSLGKQDTPSSFKIIPETAGVIKAVLAGNEDEGTVFTITAAQVTAYTGKPLPLLISRIVKTGTTATFSVVW